jgi:hypothetical protein
MSRSKAIELYEVLSETLSAESMLDFLICNYLSGAQALEAMEATRKEFYDDDEEEDEDEEVDGSSWRESEDYFDEDERELEEIKRIEEDEK